MIYDDSSERAALINGLRDLANFLESNPEVLAPLFPAVLTFPPDSDWAKMQSEIDATAVRLGVAARKTAYGHYVAARLFGPVEYRAVAIPPKGNSGNAESE